MKVAFTGGHLTPALAVIDEIKKKNVEIIFLGRGTSIEGDNSPSAESIVIPNLGIKFFAIAAGRIQRKFTIHTIPSVTRIPVGILQSLAILGKERPDVIVSFGSYVAFPVVFAGWILGIPSITHEQTSKAGLANKAVAKFAKKIALSWEVSKANFPESKTIVTGNPIRKEILNLKKIRTTRPVVFITGGNQGAHVINESVSEILEELLSNYEVFHQTGGSEIYKDFEKLKAAAALLPKRLRNRYVVAKWFNTNEQGEIFAKASLVVGRSGANTVSEVSALGIPAVFIPIPWSTGDEQTANAKILQDLGSAVVLPQDRLTPNRLLNTIDHVLNNLKEFKSNASKARNLINKDAAKNLTEEILAIASTHAK